MATVLLVLVVVLVIAGLVYGVISLLSDADPGLVPAEPDGRARPLPNDRSLHEEDLKEVRFDVALRGYRMGQVDRVLRRTAYDLGYKDEMIAVLEAEVAALREGRLDDAEVLRQAREDAASPEPGQPPAPPSTRDEQTDEADADEADADEGDAGAADEQDESADRGDGKAEDDGKAVAEEPREGSLIRRNPVPDVSALVVEPVPTPATSDGPELETADRPAHA